jgi:hypothetical protein
MSTTSGSHREHARPGDTTAATGQTILIYKYEKAQRI